jgi:hypothetical protein
MFSLTKTDDRLILRYAVSPLRRLVLIGAGIGGMTIGAHQTVHANPTTMAVVAPILIALAVLAYFWMADLPVTVEFDCERRRVTVDCMRPWFGPPRSFAFTDIIALSATKESDSESGGDYWEVRLACGDGTKIRLGQERAGRNERVRGYLAEIRSATGIAGS